ncbi:hypothetical protein Ddc_19650 [Ditylenchus destructor]|nr:hypothetical protein Ddc_19650 [Ditylenchus destructor]
MPGLFGETSGYGNLSSRAIEPPVMNQVRRGIKCDISDPDVQIIDCNRQELSLHRQIQGIISNRHLLRAQGNVPVGFPAFTVESPDGFKYNFMGSFRCVDCRDGWTPCTACRKNISCRMCCKH